MAWNKNVPEQLHSVLMLNWIDLDRTVYLHKNWFGI